ncbi:MAG: ABC transporter ATP-binding protein [Pseudomonadota bacterium]
MFAESRPNVRPAQRRLLLAVDRLRIDLAFKRTQQTVVDDVSLTIQEGEILGLAGASGAGKTLIGSAILGMLQPPMRRAGGAILFNDTTIDWRDKTRARQIRGRQIGAIFQDPMTALNPLLRVGAQLTETIETHLDLRGGAAREHAIDWLHRVGIPDPKRRFFDYPHQLSGGMRQRVVIALALCCQPRLVIADEPTTALDVQTQAQIIELLQGLAQEQSTAFLLISHNLGLMAQIASRLLILNQGRIVEEGPTIEILSRPDHAYTRGLIAAVPELGGLRPQSDAGKRRYLSGVTPGRRVSDPPSPVLLCVENVTKSFERTRSFIKETSGLMSGWRWRKATLDTGDRTESQQPESSTIRAVNDASFRLRCGQTLALVGESGSGKSTIARLVAGLLRPNQGSIRIAGIDPTLADRKEAAKLTRLRQMVFQDPYSSLNPRWRVHSVLVEPLFAQEIVKTRSEARRQTDELLERVGLRSQDGERYPHEFSGGQRQRIAIARALASQPQILICDEPTSALDVSVQAQILTLLSDLQAEFGLAMLFISHDLAVVSQMADEIAVLRHGEICEFAKTDDLLRAPQHAYTRTLLDCAPKWDLAADEASVIDECPSFYPEPKLVPA